MRPRPRPGRRGGRRGGGRPRRSRSGWWAPIGSRSAGVAEHDGGDGERLGPQAVDAAGVVLERERPELLELGGLEAGRRVAEQRVAPALSPTRTREVLRASASAGGAVRSTSAPTTAATSSHARSESALGVGVQGGAHGDGGEQPLAVGGERDGDRVARGCPSASGRARRRRGAASRRAGRAGAPWPAAARPRRRRRRARPRGSPATSAASNAARAASPWTAKTTRSSREPPSRWRRTSSTSTRAASSSGKRPTPVPNATSARLRRAEAVGELQRGRGGAADDVLRRRAAEAHRGGVDDPARGHRARGRLDRLAEPDRRLGVGFPLDLRAARAGDRARYAAAVREIGVRGVGDRVDLERGDVCFEHLDRRHRGYRTRMAVRRRVTAHGRVQGVFFRDSTREEAQRRGVTGWVRNTHDGSVEAVFEGELRRRRGARLVRPLGAGQRRRRPRRRGRGGAGGAAAASKSALDPRARGGWIGLRWSPARAARPTAAPVAAEPERKSAPAVARAGPEAVLWMQRTAGNAAVARTVARTATQSMQRCGAELRLHLVRQRPCARRRGLLDEKLGAGLLRSAVARRSA